MIKSLYKFVFIVLLISIIPIKKVKSQTITKNGQFLFLKGYDSCSHFIMDDSLLFISNKKTKSIDVFNLFQKKLVTNIKYELATVDRFFDYNTYAVKTDPPNTPNLGTRHNWSNVVNFLQDNVNLYFLVIQNSNTYFVKIEKNTYKEIWKIRINAGRVAFTLFNKQIIFWSDQHIAEKAIFQNANSTADITVSPGLVIYNTDGFILKTFKIDVGRGIPNPFFIQKKDTLILGFNTYTNNISTDSFTLAPITGTTNIALGTKRMVANKYGTLVAPWTNIVTSGIPSSSDTNILKVTLEWNGRLLPSLTSTDYYIQAQKIGTAFLLYTFNDLNGKKITTSIPITVTKNETNNPYTPTFCLLSFDKNLNYFDNNFFTTNVQGGYYDEDNDSTYLYGTTNNLSSCCTYNGMKLNDSLTLYDKGFNYILSFKNFKTFDFSLTKFDKYYSEGFGSTIFIDKFFDKQVFYMPFKGSILFNSPYTSLAGTQYYSGENFISGFMSKTNPGIIDDTKTTFFRSLSEVSAGFIKSRSTYSITTDNYNFFTDKKYVDTGLYIMTMSKDKILDPDSLSIYVTSCLPPLVKNYVFCDNQILTPLTASINGSGSLQWYGSNAIGGTSTANAPIPSSSKIGSSSYYVSQKSSLLGCESPRSKIDVTIQVSPTKPNITRDTTNFLLSNTNNIVRWYKDGMQLIDSTFKLKPTTPGNYSAKSFLNGCLSDFSNTYYYFVTDIINLSASEFIKLVPNPFINQLNFDFIVKGYQRLNIEVFDIATGAKVAIQQNLTPGMSIYLGHLSAGTYVIKVSSNDLKISYQFKMVKL